MLAGATVVTRCQQIARRFADDPPANNPSPWVLCSTINHAGPSSISDRAFARQAGEKGGYCHFARLFRTRRLRAVPLFSALGTQGYLGQPGRLGKKVPVKGQKNRQPGFLHFFRSLQGWASLGDAVAGSTDSVKIGFNVSKVNKNVAFKMIFQAVPAKSPGHGIWA